MYIFTSCFFSILFNLVNHFNRCHHLTLFLESSKYISKKFSLLSGTTLTSQLKQKQEDFEKKYLRCFDINDKVSCQSFTIGIKFTYLLLLNTRHQYYVFPCAIAISTCPHVSPQLATKNCTFSYNIYRCKVLVHIAKLDA